MRCLAGGDTRPCGKVCRPGAGRTLLRNPSERGSRSTSCWMAQGRPWLCQILAFARVSSLVHMVSRVAAFCVFRRKPLAHSAGRKAEPLYPPRIESPSSTAARTGGATSPVSGRWGAVRRPEVPCTFGGRLRDPLAAQVWFQSMSSRPEWGCLMECQRDECALAPPSLGAFDRLLRHSSRSGADATTFWKHGNSTGNRMYPTGSRAWVACSRRARAVLPIQRPACH
jgi:hypothetical protein